MKNFTFSALIIAALGFSATAQLCEPTFVFGCSNWKNNYVVVGGLDWTFDGVDCSTSDYTTDYTATVSAGVPTYMEVENANWCGCSVWVDFNHDNLFADSENLYHAGNGSTETNVFVFDITVPPSTPNGTYTMRVIASWGSDGYTPGTNGYGGCGAYQYGGFNDFAFVVENGGAGLDETESDFSIFPNPANSYLEIKTDNLTEGTDFILKDVRGSQLLTGKTSGTTTTIQLDDLQAGMYFIAFENSSKIHTFVKQ